MRTEKLTLPFRFSPHILPWLALFILALASRFFMLGARVMSHDESLHVYYSWWLAEGNGYAHNPMMHGPLLFEITGLFNRLFGANDVISRLLPALVGVFLVAGIPWLLRPWLGERGALATGALLLISPYLWYYSRYNRHDILVITAGLLAVYGMLSYLRSRRENALQVLAIALALMFASMEITFFYLAIFASFWLVRLAWVTRLHWAAVRRRPEFDVLVVLVTLGAFFSAPIALLLLNPLWTRATGAPFVPLEALAVYDTSWASGVTGQRLWGLLAVFWAAAAAIGLWWDWRRWWKLAALFLGICLVLYTTVFTNPAGFGTGFIDSLGYWLSQHEVQRGTQPPYYYLVVFPLYEFLPLLAGLGALLYAAMRRPRPVVASPEPLPARSSVADGSQPALDNPLVPLAGWWAILILVGLSIAGEKMPWLSSHLTVPWILLAGWGAGQLLDGIRPAQPGEDRPRVSFGRLAGLTALLILALLTLRTGLLLNYRNYDLVTEFVGYAHGAPGVKWAMADIDRLAEATGMGQSMKVASDDEIAWPMSWYLRDYPGFFGAGITRQAVADAPVVVVGSKNWKKADQYLGLDYARYEVIRLWWPMEDYKNLTGERLRYALTNPEMRAALWDIFWKRDYTRYAAAVGAENLDPPRRWQLEDRMRVYIRKDLTGLLQPSALAASRLPDLEPTPDAYAGVRVELTPVQTLTGPAEQPLAGPRNLAFAPDGSLYVANSGANQVLHLSAQGALLHSWGSRTPDGQVPPAPGTFNEPWGIAVGPDGSVYVADTWNHRVQKFTADGAFLLQWGVGGLRAEGADRFWGPRAVAIGADGTVYVTDTGNKRVAAFDPQGAFLFDFATGGEASLEEPVGLAVGPDGSVYVADTWNLRVAVFDPQGQFRFAWPVQMWNSDTLDNKPYLAVDAAGNVVTSDPEGYQVVLFDGLGQPLAAHGRFGEEANAFGLPNGVAIDAQGRIWVADAANNRITAYPPGLRP